MQYIKMLPKKNNDFFDLQQLKGQLKDSSKNCGQLSDHYLVYINTKYELLFWIFWQEVKTGKYINLVALLHPKTQTG